MSILRLTALLGMILSLAGCLAVVHPASPRTNRLVDPAPAPIPVAVQEYHYYPALEVYYCPQRDVYFWQQGEGWRSGRSLPARYEVRGRRHVTVKLDVTRPFSQHTIVVRDHPRQPVTTARPAPRHKARPQAPRHDARPPAPRHDARPSTPRHTPRPAAPTSWSYHYYPDSEVYFCPQRKMYFWCEGDDWRSGNRLPRLVSLNGQSHVVVKLEVRKPFNQHSVVTRRHPSKRKWSYQYYPASEVYFCPQRKTYFWCKANDWRSGNGLPPGIDLSDESHVMVTLTARKPFTQHSVVSQQHPKPRTWTYHYYPGPQVYFCPQREMYFWCKGDDQWRSGKKLPNRINLKRHRVVELEVKRPYLRHAEVVEKYPGGKKKGNKRGRK